MYLRRDQANTFRVPRFHCLRVVGRVEEFMHINLDQQLTLHDFCRVAQASQRTVEYAFSTIYGIGPKQYLKFLRLTEVRRTLKSALDNGLSIRDVARRYGFLHVGHFFSEYNNLFGETPDQTRRTGSIEGSQATRVGSNST